VALGLTALPDFAQSIVAELTHRPARSPYGGGGSEILAAFGRKPPDYRTFATS